MQRDTTRELYLSVDAEVDGHVPGPYSMVSLGACAGALRHADGAIEPLAPDAHTFYAELRPISERYIDKALRMTGLEREALERDGREPREAMTEFADWVDEVASGRDARPVLAAFPLGMTWPFVTYYLVEFAGRSPFGQSAHLDLKSAYAALADSAVRDTIRRRMPSSLLGPRDGKTGNALGDAQGNVDLLVGLLRWSHEGRG